MQLTPAAQQRVTRPTSRAVKVVNLDKADLAPAMRDLQVVAYLVTQEPDSNDELGVLREFVDDVGDVWVEALNEGVDTVVFQTKGAERYVNMWGTTAVENFNWVLGDNVESAVLATAFGYEDYGSVVNKTNFNDQGVATSGVSFSKSPGNTDYANYLAWQNATWINVTGNNLDNTFIGNAASNRFTGGLGNDTYTVGDDDQAVELAGGGTDTVRTLNSYTLGANVENLILTDGSMMSWGSGSSGTGNELDNTIIGNSGGNVLDGAGGSDTMRGGGGSDTYYVDSALDVVVEDSAGQDGGSEDKVFSAIDYALGYNV